MGIAGLCADRTDEWPELGESDGVLGEDESTEENVLIGVGGVQGAEPDMAAGEVNGTL
jgi:hypothetical protein